MTLTALRVGTLNPSEGPGLAAPVGTIYLDSAKRLTWIKFGVYDTAWRLALKTPFDPLPVVTFDAMGMQESPWWRSPGWHGRVISVDGLALETVVPAIENIYSPVDSALLNTCVKHVLAWSGPTDPKHYYETSVGLALLPDGRYVGWASFIDVTGSGFHEDAYGGDADIFVAMSPVDILRNLGERDVELLRFASDPSEHQLVSVLWDAWSGGSSRVRLCDIARTSGEFGDLVEYRIDDLILHVWKDQAARVTPCDDEGGELP